MCHLDRMNEKLERLGVGIEPREAGPVAQLAASGAGSILGSLVGGALGLPSLGRALVSLAGAVAGQLAITHEIVRRTPPALATSPAAFSDRR